MKSTPPEQLELPLVVARDVSDYCDSCDQREFYGEPREACARELDARRCCVFCDAYRETRSIEFGSCVRLGTLTGSGYLCPHFTCEDQ